MYNFCVFLYIFVTLFALIYSRVSGCVGGTVIVPQYGRAAFYQALHTITVPLHCTQSQCHCTALHYTILHCMALYYNILHITALHYTTLHGTTLYCTTLKQALTELYCIAFQCIAQQHTVFHCIVLHAILQYTVYFTERCIALYAVLHCML